MSELTLHAPAKINLALTVGPRRPDGFHEIESLVAPIDLCDELRLRRLAAGELRLSCNDPTLPADERNLALRAALRLREHAGRPDLGAAITLTKRIPAGAGLGGGSSDAAATLRGLAQLWELSLSHEALCEIAARLGSDVPLFLFDSPVVVRGRGEQVEPVRGLPPAWVVLIVPQVRCATARVYDAFDALPAPPARPAAGVIATARDAGRLLAACFNDLEPAAMHVCPPLRGLHADVQARLDRPVRMSGSGSAFFTLFDRRQQALAAAQRLCDDFRWSVEVCRMRCG